MVMIIKNEKAMKKYRYLFKIYYIGKSKYYGSQRQPNFLTIEDEILRALVKRGYIANIGDSGFEVASRTDKFVSARGACFTCIIEKNPILMEINSALPKDLGVWAYSKVPLEFSSRHNAILRHYLYLYPRSPYNPQNQNSLNLDLMHKACRKLEGRHNFINFSKREKKEKTTIRDLESVQLSIKNDFLIFQFKSRAFLRQQIRRIVKKIIDLGLGEIEYEEFLELFDPSKSFSYEPANPRGLILWDIAYNRNIFLTEDPKSRMRMESFFLQKENHFNFKYQLFRLLQHHDSS